MGQDWPVEELLRWNSGCMGQKGTCSSFWGQAQEIVWFWFLIHSVVGSRTLLHCVIIFVTQVVSFSCYCMCELQLDWVAHGNGNLTLSVLACFRAFLSCWLQILLGGIRPRPELGGKSSKGESCKRQDPPADGTNSSLDTLQPSNRVKALALHSGSLNSRMSVLLRKKRADKRLEV